MALLAGIKHLRRREFFRAVVAIVLPTMFLMMMVPNFRRDRGGGTLTACKSNLKNMGTAMEMYSTDWSGKYPRSASMLTPNYLKTFPTCPQKFRMSYEFEFGQTATYNTQSFEDYYFIRCTGDDHTLVSVPPGYPQYNGIVGLIER